MKKIFSLFFVLTLISVLFYSCKKDIEQKVIVMPAASSQQFKASANSIVLTTANKTQDVVTFSFNAPDYGIKLVPSYTLQFDLPADTSGADAWGKAVEIKLTADDSTSKSFNGADLNALLTTQLNLNADEATDVVVRLKTDVNQNTGVASAVEPIYSVVKINVTPFADIVVYPALMVIEGDGWQTPTERTNGFVLTSSKFNTKYEGYLDLPNANGWGGDGFQLKSTATGKTYGWGADANTISENGGNLWLTPSPNYMKVNVDLSASTITYTPVKFFISGDDNGWSTSSTPMTYNPTTKKWVAENVSLTADKVFVFTANGGYDISYKVDDKGVLVFAGGPAWAGTNIPVKKTGVFTVTLDLSAGDGNYTYNVE